MSTLFLEPFDILFKDLFNTRDGYLPAANANIKHPLDIYETKSGLHFEIACTGLSKSDIQIDREFDILRVSYDKPQSTEESIGDKMYIKHGLSRKAFNLAYKISSRFNLDAATATMENGLLSITIPLAEESKPKLLEIN